MVKKNDKNDTTLPPPLRHWVFPMKNYVNGKNALTEQYFKFFPKIANQRTINM